MRGATVCVLAGLALSGCGGRDLSEAPPTVTTEVPSSAISPIPDRWVGTYHRRLPGRGQAAPGLWRLEVEKRDETHGLFKLTHVTPPRFSVPMTGQVRYGRLRVEGNPVSTCASVGAYDLRVSRRRLTFVPVVDGCVDRKEFISQRPWLRRP